jgi:hypothetical protein
LQNGWKRCRRIVWTTYILIIRRLNTRTKLQETTKTHTNTQQKTLFK